VKGVYGAIYFQVRVLARTLDLHNYAAATSLNFANLLQPLAFASHWLYSLPSIHLISLLLSNATILTFFGLKLL
jgi:hypothetical protein